MKKIPLNKTSIHKIRIMKTHLLRVNIPFFPQQCFVLKWRCSVLKCRPRIILVYPLELIWLVRVMRRHDTVSSSLPEVWSDCQGVRGTESFQSALLAYPSYCHVNSHLTLFAGHKPARMKTSGLFFMSVTGNRFSVFI